jgi:hypothetical protein
MIICVKLLIVCKLVKSQELRMLGRKRSGDQARKEILETGETWKATALMRAARVPFEIRCLGDM